MWSAASQIVDDCISVPSYKHLLNSGLRQWHLEPQPLVGVLDFTTMLLMNWIARLTDDRNGVTALEYTLVTVVIAVVVIAGVNTIGTSLADAFTSLSQALSQRAAGI